MAALFNNSITVGYLKSYDAKRETQVVYRMQMDAEPSSIRSALAQVENERSMS